MPPRQVGGEGYSLVSPACCQMGFVHVRLGLSLGVQGLAKSAPSWGLKLFGFLLLVCWSGGSSKPLPRRGHGFSVAIASPAAFPGRRKTGAVASHCSDCWKKSCFRSCTVAGSVAAHPHSLLELPGLSTWLEAGFFSSPEVR